MSDPQRWPWFFAMLPVVTHSKRSVAAFKKENATCCVFKKKNVAFFIFAKTRRRFGNGHSMSRTVALWKPRSARSAGVRHEVRTDVRVHVFTVAILAQGTNRGDALCAALLCNHEVSNPSRALLHVSFVKWAPFLFLLFSFVSCLLSFLFLQTSDYVLRFCKAI